MKCKLNSKTIILLLVISIIIVTSYSINYCFFSSSPINKYIASNIYKTPANTSFTDDNFYQCVVDAYNTINNTNVPYTTNLNDTELKTITFLGCDGYNKSDEEKIKNVNGLEKLTSLTELIVHSNVLTSLDISNNSSLTNLEASNNQLTNLDISNNPNLKYLYIDSNNLTSLDINNNSSLIELTATSNKLTSLDISGAPALEVLSVHNNGLTSLDIDNNLSLTSLNITSNELTSLNISRATALTNLSVYNNKLTNLDISSNKSLIELYAYSNELTSLDISNNLNLKTLDVHSNQLTNLDVSNNPILEILSVHSNHLTNLDISKNLSLTELYAYSNQLTSLDVSNNLNLKKIYVHFNELTNLDISRNSNLQLKRTNIGNNQYTLKLKPILKDDSINIINNKIVKLPSHFNPAVTYTTSYGLNGDEDIITATATGTQTYKLIKENPSYEETYTIEVVDITSDKYIIDKSKKYIDIGSDSIDNVLNNITTENGYSTIEENELIIKNGEDEVKRFKLIGTRSSIYDLSKNYIYTGIDSNEEIINNIETTANIKIEDNILNISYGEDYSVNYTLVRIEQKNIIHNNHIYILDTNNLDNLNIINGNKEIIDNNLVISYNEVELDRIPILTIESDNYIITNNYIYTKFNQINLDKITNINGIELLVKDSNLEITYNDILLDTIPIYSLNINSTNIKAETNKSKIYLREGVEITYQEFIEAIMISFIDGNITIKVYNENKEEVLDGNIETNYTVDILYQDTIIDTYITELIKEYVYYTKADKVHYTDNYGIDILKNLSINNTLKNVRKLIETDGIITIKDEKNNILNESSYIKTGDKFIITFPTSEYLVYLSVKGDITGTGKITEEDVSKSYKILRGNIEVAEYYKLASDINEDGKIKINDVAKLYQYTKNKIDSINDNNEKQDKIHFISVSSSDAFLIESNGLYGLIDSSNPNDDSAQAISDDNHNVTKVINYLKNLEVEKLDFILATHSHSDHIGGMPMIAEAGFVDENTKYYYRTYLGTLEDTTSPDWENGTYYEKAVNAMISKNAQMIEVTNKNPVIKLGNFNIELINTDGVAMEDAENYNSIGALLTKGNIRIFFASDIEEIDSNKVMTYLGEVDVLKLNHHSYSGFNKKYLDALNPKTIIVSNSSIEGRFKPFASDLISKGTKIYLTGSLIDAIRLSVNNNSYSIEDNINNLNAKLNGWHETSSKWYYFNEDGAMVYGWQQLKWTGGTDWFYFNEDGIMLTGWQKLTWNGVESWYYFDENGAMISNECLKIDNVNYCFNSAGACTTGC